MGIINLVVYRFVHIYFTNVRPSELMKPAIWLNECRQITMLAGHTQHKNSHAVVFPGTCMLITFLMTAKFIKPYVFKVPVCSIF